MSIIFLIFLSFSPIYTLNPQVKTSQYLKDLSPIPKKNVSKYTKFFNIRSRLHFLVYDYLEKEIIPPHVAESISEISWSHLFDPPKCKPYFSPLCRLLFKKITEDTFIGNCQEITWGIFLNDNNSISLVKDNETIFVPEREIYRYLTRVEDQKVYFNNEHIIFLMCLLPLNEIDDNVERLHTGSIFNNICLDKRGHLGGFFFNHLPPREVYDQQIEGSKLEVFYLYLPSPYKITSEFYLWKLFFHNNQDIMDDLYIFWIHWKVIKFFDNDNDSLFSFEAYISTYHPHIVINMESTLLQLENLLKSS